MIPNDILTYMRFLYPLFRHTLILLENPKKIKMRLRGFEPRTPALSEQCSNQTELQPLLKKINKLFINIMNLQN